MAHSQFKTYKIFGVNEEVVEPFYLVRVLSNGEKVGKAVVDSHIEGSITSQELIEYMNNNHTYEEEI